MTEKLHVLVSFGCHFLRILEPEGVTCVTIDCVYKVASKQCVKEKFLSSSLSANAGAFCITASYIFWFWILFLIKCVQYKQVFLWSNSLVLLAIIKYYAVPGFFFSFAANVRMNFEGLLLGFFSDYKANNKSSNMWILYTSTRKQTKLLVAEREWCRYLVNQHNKICLLHF